MLVARTNINKNNKIPFIPSLVDIADVIDSGGRLIPMEQIAEIKEKIAEHNNLNGRYTKTTLKTKFSVTKIGDKYYAIYKGEKHDKLLGKGSFGSVKFVQNIDDGSWAVIKTVPIKKSASHEDHNKTIAKETKNLDQVQHLIGHLQRQSPSKGMQDEIIMTLAHGATVKKIAEHRKMPAVKWLDLGIEIMRATAHIHEQGIYHRDIKPANMLYDPATDVVTLIDFGLARLFDKESRNYIGSYAGSPKFMAPEISVRSKKKKVKVAFNEQTEVYALGMTLLEIYHLEKTGHDVKATIEFSEKIRNRTLQDEIIKLVASMIHPKSGSRPDLQTALLKLIELRENELDLASKVNTLAYLNVGDYMSATLSQRNDTILTMEAADHVQLCTAHENVMDCMRIKHELEGHGIGVSDQLILLENPHDIEAIISQLKENTVEKAQNNKVIYTACYLQATRQLAASLGYNMTRSIDRVDLTDLHKTMALINVEAQIDRLQRKDQADTRLQFLRKFIYDIEHGEIRTYRHLFNALESLQIEMQNKPDKSKLGSFARKFGLSTSTAASEIGKTGHDILKHAYGRSTSASKK